MKNVFSTTAVTLLLATSVVADSHSTAEAEMDAGVSVGVGADTEMSTDVSTDVEAMADSDAQMDMPNFEREGYTMAGVDVLAAGDLDGAIVYDVNDENVGEVSEIQLDGDSISHVVIDFGGFLGMGEKRILISIDDLVIQTEDNGSDVRVYVSATEEELDAMAEYEG